jgi:hypothetical protein
MAGVGACCVGVPVTRLRDILNGSGSAAPDSASSSNREGKASREELVRDQTLIGQEIWCCEHQ